jgi:hypothetical protein
MNRFFTMMTRLLLGTAVVAVLLPTGARAQTCNALLSIGVAPGGQTDFGDVRTITLTMGAGGIIGGTQLTINAVRYDLDCDDDSPLTIPCDDQGDIFNYQSDGSIVSNCGTCDAGDLNAGEACSPAGPGGGCDLLINGDNLGTCVAVTWTSNVPAGGSVINEIVFTPSAPLVNDANNFPICDLSFDVQLDNLELYVGPDSDSDPMNTAVVAGFASGDAVCDNSLESTPSEVAFIPLAPLPVCGDSQIDPGETCDPVASIPALPPGNLNECRADCTYCGDGILQAPETCDTGGVFNRACNPNCTGRIARDPASIIFFPERPFDRRGQRVHFPPVIDPNAGVRVYPQRRERSGDPYARLTANSLTPRDGYKFKNRMRTGGLASSPSAR